MTDRLFVYGTLRKDIRNSMFHLLAREASFVGGARARGRLFSLGDHPGFVPSDAPDSWVHGELHALDDSPEILPRLDEYEECGPDDPRPHEFERVEMDVVPDSGGTERAWVYVYRGSTADKRQIASGDYFREAVR